MGEARIHLSMEVIVHLGVVMDVVIISLDDHLVIWIWDALMFFIHTYFYLIIVSLGFLLQNYFRCLQMVECTS